MPDPAACEHRWAPCKGEVVCLSCGARLGDSPDPAAPPLPPPAPGAGAARVAALEALVSWIGLGPGWDGERAARPGTRAILAAIRHAAGPGWRDDLSTALHVDGSVLLELGDGSAGCLRFMPDGRVVGSGALAAERPDPGAVDPAALAEAVAELRLLREAHHVAHAEWLAMSAKPNTERTEAEKAAYMRVTGAWHEASDRLRWKAQQSLSLLLAGASALPAALAGRDRAREENDRDKFQAYHRGRNEGRDECRQERARLVEAVTEAAARARREALAEAARATCVYCRQGKPLAYAGATGRLVHPDADDRGQTAGCDAGAIHALAGGTGAAGEGEG